MTTPATPARRTPGSDEERAAWWATLDHDALVDEIEVNRRAERRLVPVALTAGALTVVVLLLRVLVSVA
ncbi:hypothetical protein [Cellulomonas fimi]|uniref:Uncharacterized protein n=1 Tax=Cellulomonas fimi (strain ATCC 484 / DSM 20113 / JCM 1341 / CCUG 24087 / LMG 16345 / NBRC 15513 / NCIMB 8980 / NCTC 7547 / NRS-133) TaxID=590998 RepID=F4H6P1_CELFA|nr:hypothetical protein [Cellulomonas fimi]AEE46802.1 hypothetical protein Celf_2678 [Cellulomonas fimi ATCC 484]NNH06345.1 hypothetical protein [Cellulomonas fimi]VEH34229.1 Uncharacterised protein [Cellulomonas fimi]